jgi:hypothetical protein
MRDVRRELVSTTWWNIVDELRQPDWVACLVGGGAGICAALPPDNAQRRIPGLQGSQAMPRRVHDACNHLATFNYVHRVYLFRHCRQSTLVLNHLLAHTQVSITMTLHLQGPCDGAALMPRRTEGAASK